jgi:hypothetical protein
VPVPGWLHRTPDKILARVWLSHLRLPGVT